MSNSEEKSEQQHDHEATVIVNGREKTVIARELTFDEVVKLADDNPPTGPNIMVTVTYRRGHGQKPDGTLMSGDVVRVKDGMIFNVSFTDKS